jgi:hypothetical protein
MVQRSEPLTLQNTTQGFMRSHRVFSKLPLAHPNKRLLKPSRIRKMSIFHQGFGGNRFVNEAPSFHPLFRMLDDFDNFTRGSNATGGVLKTFQPKFDVKETSENYE